MPEVDRVAFERLQLRALEAQRELLDAVARHPDVSEAWTRWRAAESAVMEAARGLREAEVHEPGGEV